MSNQAEIDAALDKLEIENDVDVMEHNIDNNAMAENGDNDVESGDSGELSGDDDQKTDNPPGYIDNLDDWVAAGKDPDLFKGKKAYEQEYERIQEIRELKGLVKTVVDTTSDWKQQQQTQMDAQIEQAKVDAQVRLDAAKEEDDIDGALNAQKDLNELNKPKQVVKPEVVEASPILTDFFKKNPILDKSSDRFDPEFWDTMSMAQQTVLNGLTGGDVSIKLSDSQVARSMSIAYEKAKEFHADKFESPRNKRRGNSNPAPKRGGNQGGDTATKLKNLNIPTKNRRDTSATNDVYEMIKASDPARAEEFAKTMLGE